MQRGCGLGAANQLIGGIADIQNLCHAPDVPYATSEVNEPALRLIWFSVEGRVTIPFGYWLLHLIWPTKTATVWRTIVSVVNLRRTGGTVGTPNLAIETMELINQLTPQPGFQHVDHPKVLLGVAQEMFRRHQFMGPQADRVLKSLQSAAQEYVQLYKPYVSMETTA